MDSGFESVDGFQRAFYGEFGVNPGTYATHPVHVPYFIPYGVKFRKENLDAAKALSGQKNDLQGDNEKMETKNIFIQLIKKPARKVLIKRAMRKNVSF